MDKTKIALIVFNVVCLALFTFVIVWSITNWSTIKSSFDGTKLYTQTALDEAYKQGLGDKEKYEQRINNYKEQIETLNKTIKELTDENTLLKNNEKYYISRISELEKQVAELKNKVKYYEELLSAYENVNKLIATFMYNDEVYLVQLYESGSKITIEAPADTDRLKFNGWTVNGQPVDLETYTITENTTFVANLTHYKFVTYKDGNTVLKSQKIEKGQTLTVANYSAPTKEYHDFIEWQVNEAPASATYIVNDDIELNAKYKYALIGQYVYNLDASYATKTAEFVMTYHLTIVGVVNIYDDSTIMENTFLRQIKESIGVNASINITLENHKIIIDIACGVDGSRTTNIVFDPILMRNETTNLLEVEKINHTATNSNLQLNEANIHSCDENLSENYVNIFLDGKLIKSIKKSDVEQKLLSNYEEVYRPEVLYKSGNNIAKAYFNDTFSNYFIFLYNRVGASQNSYRKCVSTGSFEIVSSNDADKDIITIQFKDISTNTLNNGVKYEYQI